MALSGAQAERLSDALKRAFPKLDLLGNLIWFKCDKNLEDIVGHVGLDSAVPLVIRRAIAEGWIDRLVGGALRQNPGNAELRAFYDSAWLALDQGPQIALEAEVRKGNPFLDVDVWVEDLVLMGSRICRVEVETDAGMGFGTGFLVGPGVVLTNYHVLAPVIRTESGEPSHVKARAVNVACRFDFKMVPGDTDPSPGRVFRLAGPDIKDWLLDSSRDGDTPVAYDAFETPDREHLDYALVRLASEPGHHVVRLGAPTPKRGWVAMRPGVPEFKAGSAVLILQHPSHRPLKLAMDMVGIIGVNAKRTRVRYRTNTLPGSSGSPCFDVDWNFIALHHAGDPATEAKSNQGIPVDALLALMTERGSVKHLGAV